MDPIEKDQITKQIEQIQRSMDRIDEHRVKIHDELFREFINFE